MPGSLNLESRPWLPGVAPALPRTGNMCSRWPDWLTTPAGTGLTTPNDFGHCATKASLSEACGVGVDRSGNLVIADTCNYRVEVVAASTGTFCGQAMLARRIYSVAGAGKHGFSGDDGPGTRAQLAYPYGVAVDGAGNLLIADTDNNRIREVTG